MSFIDATSFNNSEYRLLFKLAHQAISHGLAAQQLPTPNLSDYPPALRQILASFVTLHCDQALRGCIGSLQAKQPLILDVAHNAYRAAFHDPRFSPLTVQEFEHTDITISVLSEPEPLAFANEEDLIKQLRPGIDGLILTDKTLRGTFLPVVWQSLPDAHDFLRALKQKAGLAPNHWSNTLTVARYEVVSFGEKDAHKKTQD